MFNIPKRRQGASTLSTPKRLPSNFSSAPYRSYTVPLTGPAGYNITSSPSAPGQFPTGRTASGPTFGSPSANRQFPYSQMAMPHSSAPLVQPHQLHLHNATPFLPYERGFNSQLPHPHWPPFPYGPPTDYNHPYAQPQRFAPAQIQNMGYYPFHQPYTQQPFYPMKDQNMGYPAPPVHHAPPSLPPPMPAPRGGHRPVPMNITVPPSYYRPPPAFIPGVGAEVELSPAMTYSTSGSTSAGLDPSTPFTPGSGFHGHFYPYDHCAPPPPSSTEAENA